MYILFKYIYTLYIYTIPNIYIYMYIILLIFFIYTIYILYIYIILHISFNIFLYLYIYIYLLLFLIYIYHNLHESTVGWFLIEVVLRAMLEPMGSPLRPRSFLWSGCSLVSIGVLSVLEKNLIPCHVTGWVLVSWLMGALTFWEAAPSKTQLLVSWLIGKNSP